MSAPRKINNTLNKKRVDLLHQIAKSIVYNNSMEDIEIDFDLLNEISDHDSLILWASTRPEYNGIFNSNINYAKKLSKTGDLKNAAHQRDSTKNRKK